MFEDSLVYSGFGGVFAAVQPDVDDPPAEELVPRHHVHPVTQLCHTQDTHGTAPSHFNPVKSDVIVLMF